MTETDTEAAATVYEKVSSSRHLSWVESEIDLISLKTTRQKETT